MYTKVSFHKKRTLQKKLKLKNKLSQALVVIVFFLLGILLFWYIYKDYDFTDILTKIQTDFEYSWIWIATFAGILSHFIRAVRWRMLIMSLGYNPSISNSFAAVMVMYFANLVVPRSGEAVRCGIISKYEKVPFTKLLGTVVIERVIDLLVLMGLTFMVIIFEFDVILKFVDKNPEVKNKLIVLNAYKYYFIFTWVLGLVLLYLFKFQLRNTFLFKKIHSFSSGVVEGFKTIKKLEHKKTFWLHTFFIWILYFFLIYLCFFSFQPTKHLSALSGFTTLVMSSYGMATPIQGGVGAWHFMVTETLSIYGIDKELHGKIFALVAHGLITLSLLVAGTFAFISLPIINRKIKKRILKM